MSALELDGYLFRITLAWIVGVFLFGCTLYPDVNSDPAKNNNATFQGDALDCARSYPETSSGVHVK